MNDVTNLFAREGEVDDDTRAAIAEAIRGAYPNPGREFFYLRLRNKWGVDVADDITALDQGGTVIMDRIVRYAQANGRLLDLLALAWSDVSGNPKLLALAREWLSDLEAARAKYAPAPVKPPAADLPRPALEELVTARSRLINLGTFLKRLQHRSAALCRIGTPKSKGTGFLVGRHTVLTNYHVVKKAIAAGIPGDQIICEFDYDNSDSVTVPFTGAAGLSWRGPNSPYSESDVTGIGEPKPGELDYALITLSQDVEGTRPVIEWPALSPVVSQRDFILICQHPGGRSSELSIGEVLDYPGQGLRYRYDATTETGSSGSPVFDMDLNLVALHHAADPDRSPDYNQGVPIARIMADLKAVGLDLKSL